MTTPTTPEGRLYDAGFTRRLEFWVPPGTDRALRLEDAIAHLDSGTVKPPSFEFPDSGIRAFPDELVDLACPPPLAEAPEPPPWLLDPRAVACELGAVAAGAAVAGGTVAASPDLTAAAPRIRGHDVRWSARRPAAASQGRIRRFVGLIGSEARGGGRHSHA
jgi:hypothetical protein